MKPRTYRELLKYCLKRLEPIYGSGESRALSVILLEEYTGISGPDRIMSGEFSAPDEAVHNIEIALSELELHKPVQYITGKTEFMGIDLTVDEHVLIPRPETEGLVDWVLRENTPDSRLKLLDVGTGSGNIAIAIKKSRPSWEVHACDISKKALQVAEKNAGLYEAQIEFFEWDIRSEPLSFKKPPYNIIVSNPPYVRTCEKDAMCRNVKDYEPGIALFTDDRDPFVCYRQILDFGKHHLTAGGSFYFEINQYLYGELGRALRSCGLRKITFRKDFRDHCRYVKCVKP